MLFFTLICVDECCSIIFSDFYTYCSPRSLHFQENSFDSAVTANVATATADDATANDAAVSQVAARVFSKGFCLRQLLEFVRMKG